MNLKATAWAQTLSWALPGAESLAGPLNWGGKAGVRTWLQLPGSRGRVSRLLATALGPFCGKGDLLSPCKGFLWLVP